MKQMIEFFWWHHHYFRSFLFIISFCSNQFVFKRFFFFFFLYFTLNKSNRATTTIKQNNYSFINAILRFMFWVFCFRFFTKFFCSYWVFWSLFFSFCFVSLKCYLYKRKTKKNRSKPLKFIGLDFILFFFRLLLNFLYPCTLHYTRARALVKRNELKIVVFFPLFVWL